MGLVVFLILVIIQFVVITRGAERVAEVAARFTLDAMPGKQMSIDADLNAGLITEEEARERRRAVEQEADFYGAMDGASKFVKGDAIAALIITVVNLLGGFGVGMLQHGLPAAEAWHKYALLTVGNGLVCQLPALIISTATGIIVTRAHHVKTWVLMSSARLPCHPGYLGLQAGHLLCWRWYQGCQRRLFLIGRSRLLLSRSAGKPDRRSCWHGSELTERNWKSKNGLSQLKPGKRWIP